LTGGILVNKWTTLFLFLTKLNSHEKKKKTTLSFSHLNFPLKKKEKKKPHLNFSKAISAFSSS
jgi:hypothetical protein